MTEVLLWLLLFTPVVALFSASGIGGMTSMLIVNVACVIFPYRRKAIFEASAVKQRIAGIPAMTLAGLGGVAALLTMLYYFVTVPALAAYGPITVYVMVAELVLAGLLYFSSKTYHIRKDGIDIALAFKQVPPE
jgi:hypothetical protein